MTNTEFKIFAVDLNGNLIDENYESQAKVSARWDEIRNTIKWGRCWQRDYSEITLGSVELTIGENIPKKDSRPEIRSEQSKLRKRAS